MIQVYNENDITNAILKAQNEGYKLTFSSECNSDSSSFTSYNKYIQLHNKMNKIIEINTFYDYIIVESGATWLEIIKELDKHNYTLISCQSGLNFSVGGSFCGNAHGKKTQIPMVKDTIIEFVFIDGKGNKHIVNNTDLLFHAFPGSLGLLGIITTIKIKICKKYGIILNIKTIPLNQDSLNYIKTLYNSKKVCMINFQSSYFKNIKEIILSIFYYKDCELTKINVTKYETNMRVFYTVIVLFLWFLSNFKILDQVRWNIEKQSLLSSSGYGCVNINNSFDTWSKTYIPKFKIIEFFFPENAFLYCQREMMNIFENNNMIVLSSGSRIVFEQHKTPGFLRFSQHASKTFPYISLVINFLENSKQLNELTNEIREKIFKKNILMTYHTTYEWNFKKEDIYFMFPDVNHFIKIKKDVDPYDLFSNKFYEKYIMCV